MSTSPVFWRNRLTTYQSTSFSLGGLVRWPNLNLVLLQEVEVGIRTQ